MGGWLSKGFRGSSNPRSRWSAAVVQGYVLVAAARSVVLGARRSLHCLNSYWQHPYCLRCHACNVPIADYECFRSGNYLYHKTCYKERYHPKCHVCKHFIPTNQAGRMEGRTHRFWNYKYCLTHRHDNTPRCCSCKRLEPRDARYVALKDGRKLCLECLDSAVTDLSECQPIYDDVQLFYERLNMKVEQSIPLFLVERRALNESKEGEKQGHSRVAEIRGRCLISQEKTKTTIQQAADMITERHKVTRRWYVTAIHILCGLPRLLTGSIIAHEMMHAWMRLNGYHPLSRDVEEGMCQVMSHMWLDTQLNSDTSFSPSSIERRLGSFFKHLIEIKNFPVYGDGFRAGQVAVGKYGLGRTLEHIRMTGRFPCPDETGELHSN